MGATWSVQDGARSKQRLESLARDLQVLEELQLSVCPELVWDDFDGAVLVHSATNALRNEMAFRLYDPSRDPSASDSYPGSSIVRFVAAWKNRAHAVASRDDCDDAAGAPKRAHTRVRVAELVEVYSADKNALPTLCHVTCDAMVVAGWTRSVEATCAPGAHCSLGASGTALLTSAAHSTEKDLQAVASGLAVLSRRARPYSSKDDSDLLRIRWDGLQTGHRRPIVPYTPSPRSRGSSCHSNSHSNLKDLDSDGVDFAGELPASAMCFYSEERPDQPLPAENSAGKTNGYESAQSSHSRLLSEAATPIVSVCSQAGSRSSM